MYRLMSLTETARDGEPLFWHKDQECWVDKAQASTYTAGQTFLYGNKENARWISQDP